MLAIEIGIVIFALILVVIFDSKSSLGLVRLRVRKSSEELGRIFDALLSKVQEPGGDSPFAEITDEDFENFMEQNVLPIFRNKIRLVFSELKEADAAILGASALVWESK